jgi:hypothetical protein
VISALDPAAKEITINMPITAGAKPMVIAFAPGATLRRYAPNSVKFSDARPSRFEELKVGDQVKALGTADETRSRYTAEELVAGSFGAIAGAVVSIDAAQNTFVITDRGANKPVQARVSPDSTMRRLPAEIAQMLAARNKAGNSASLKSDNFSAEMTSQYFEAHFPSTIFTVEKRISGSIPSLKFWGVRQTA